ncbi:MAG: PIG-L family deacetylase [Ktedonobacteraceae bacterium]|nr:PIG-L family deacetylase [Ktedonobacteraceae bacterium]
MSTKRLLGIFAHPDDEGMVGGALLHYNEIGVETGLVYATRGEVGEISDPSLATPETLGTVREKEMSAAAASLNVNHLWFLDYRDSGMAGTGENQDPRAFINANSAHAIGKLVAIIRTFQPQVMVTFDEIGGYGHPDHIAIYKYVTGAFHSAADDALFPEAGPAHAVSKLYYASFSRRQLAMLVDWLETAGYDNFLKDMDIQQLGLADDQISVVLDVERWHEAKARSWSQHRTQISPNSPMSHMPPELQRKWRGTEFFQLAASRVGPDLVGENNLFAHIP